MRTLQIFCKYALWLSIIAMAMLGFYKDRLPDSLFYDSPALAGQPLQTATEKTPFTVHAAGQEYLVTPYFDYELNGVVVSYNNASGLTDIWHHKRWKDFLNERDLCVIWGQNVRSGVYKRMNFENDSWTCWVSWADSATGALFKMNQLSNNHLLVDNEIVRKALMEAEPGDHVRFKGMLAGYENKANSFRRGTSTIREDTGNGACETVYLTDFEVVKKANHGLRRAYAFARGVALAALAGFLVLFFITPVRIR